MQILMENICKAFTISERPTGRFAMLRGAFVRSQRKICALDDISFEMNAGELVGYIGPNGAGKSTTVKVMSGILTPDSGNCKIMGRTPWKQRNAHVSQIGVVFGQRSQLWWDVPVSDSYDLLRNIYDIKLADYKQRLQELTAILDIGQFLRTPVRQLSLGQRMRCELVAALLHRPKILFLDEPTIGLDAVSKLALRSFLKQLNKEDGVSMVLTTHDMDDIEMLCNRVMVIGHGKLLFDGALDGLKRQYSPLHVIEAELPSPMDRVEIPGSESVEIDGCKWRIAFDTNKIPAHNMVAKVASLLPLKDISVGERDIDEMIALMYKEMSL